MWKSGFCSREKRHIFPQPIVEKRRVFHSPLGKNFSGRFSTGYLSTIHTTCGEKNRYILPSAKFDIAFGFDIADASIGYKFPLAPQRISSAKHISSAQAHIENTRREFISSAKLTIVNLAHRQELTLEVISRIRSWVSLSPFFRATSTLRMA